MKKLETPTKAQMHAIVHSVLDRQPLFANEPGDLANAVKWACAQNEFLYNGQSVTRAIESVLFVRQRRSA
jgi:hypothetical protein